MTTKCLIVDDEQLARDMLEVFANKTAGLKVVAKCKDVAEATVVIQSRPVDLVLLDVNMPQVTGVEWFTSLSNPPLVVFTTAYSQYALASYELEAVDYLLKPVGYQRFQQAIVKVQRRLTNQHKAQAYDEYLQFSEQRLLIKEGYNRHHVYLKDINYVMAMREYVRYHTSAQSLMELTSLSKLESLLPSQHFVRIHRSYIVAKAAVVGHQQNKLLLRDGKTLPIGKTYRQRVLQILFL